VVLIGTHRAILVKTWRLWKLYYRPSRPNMPPLPDLLLLKILGVALVVHILVLTFWQLLDPIQISIVDSPSGTGVNVLCEGNDTQTWMGCVFAYLGSLLLVGAILSWRTRKLPQRYNEALYIAIGVRNLLFLSSICTTDTHIL
jgi:predicted membrane channel-forming protein YqfA (hemolysin III family)